MTRTCPVCGKEAEESATTCPHCGFRLLGSTLEFQPVQSMPDDGRPPRQGPRKASLIVLRGPQNGLRFDLVKRRMTIGRAPECDIFLNDMTVSREHAEIQPMADGYVICDRNSFNGVWVNNSSIETHRLAPNDIVQIGAFLLIYEEL